MAKTNSKEASRAAVAARIAEAAKRLNRPMPLDHPILAAQADHQKPPSSAQPPVTKDAPQRPIAPTKAKPAPLVSVQIELLCTVRNQPEKTGQGYAFFSAGLTGDKGLNVNLNRDREFIGNALDRGDVMLTRFFYALLVCESLALRRNESQLVWATQSALSAPLYPHTIARSSRISLCGSPLARCWNR
jgi:hypothetical protein